MAEIKSTLDLVMEKTKHLSLSEEDKAGQQRDTYEKRIKGLLQKYGDGLYTLDDFQNQLSSMQETLGLNAKQPLVRHILGHVGPDRDNTLWLDLLETYAPQLKAFIQEIVTTYVQRRDTLLQAGMQEHQEQLKKDHQIRGSAVIPNLNRDQSIQKELKIMQKEARDKLDSLANSAE